MTAPDVTQGDVFRIFYAFDQIYLRSSDLANVNEAARRSIGSSRASSVCFIACANPFTDSTRDVFVAWVIR